MAKLRCTKRELITCRHNLRGIDDCRDRKARAKGDRTLPCLALRSYVLDGTRTKLPTPVHILAHPASLPELSRKVTFVSRSSHRNIQKMSLEKGVACFIWFMYLNGKNEQNTSFLKMIQIRTNNTRSQSIADPRESGGAAK